MRTIRGNYDREIYGVSIKDPANSRQLSQQDPDTWKRLPLPMPPVTVAAGGTANVQVAPQKRFKVVRVTFPDHGKGSGVEITDIKVGSSSQFLCNGAIDVLNLTPDSVNAWFDFTCGEVGNTFAIYYANTTATAVTLAPLVIAEVAQVGEG